MFFGADASSTTKDVPQSSRPEDSIKAPRRSYLRPFEPKADTDYVAFVKPSHQVRTRAHETLVIRFAAWLEDRGLDQAYNQAVDIGVEDPPIIIEAKGGQVVAHVGKRSHRTALWNTGTLASVHPKNPLLST